MYFGGDFFTRGSSNAGIYQVEVRGWGDNEFDTGHFVILDIEVINPCLASSPTLFSEVVSLEPQTYDLASEETLSISLPQVELTPIDCFTVSEFRVVDAKTDAIPSYISAIEDQSVVKIKTNDKSLSGKK